MGEYISYSSHRINIRGFYNDFNVNIKDISKATGVSRASVTKMAAKCASRETTEKIIHYLEEISREDYEYEVKQCRKHLEDTVKKVEQAWSDYETREEILEEYCKEYGIERKMTSAVQVTFDEMLSEIKRE